MNDNAEIKTITTAELKQFSGLDGLSESRAQMLSESLKTFSIILFRHYQQTFPQGKKGKVSENGNVKKLSALSEERQYAEQREQ